MQVPAWRYTSFFPHSISTSGSRKHIVSYRASFGFASSQLAMRLTGATRHPPGVPRRVPGTGEGSARKAALPACLAGHPTSRRRGKGGGRPRATFGLSFPRPPRLASSHTRVPTRTEAHERRLRTPGLTHPAARREPRPAAGGEAARCLPAGRSGAGPGGGGCRWRRRAAVPHAARRLPFIPAAAAACVGARAGPPANHRLGRPTKPGPPLGAKARLGGDVMPRSVSVPFTKKKK